MNFKISNNFYVELIFQVQILDSSNKAGLYQHMLGANIQVDADSEK